MGCKRLIHECRCDERLKVKTMDTHTSLTYTCFGSEKNPLQTVYYESIKRDLQTRPMYEYRSDERLKTRVEESTRLVYTTDEYRCDELSCLSIVYGTGTPKDRDDSCE